MKTIVLSQDKVAIVDDEDFEKLSKFLWHYNEKKPGHGYAQGTKHLCKIEGKYRSKTIYMHREVLPIDMEVDHINGDTLDNRKENLRPADRTLRGRNRASRKNSSSSYPGVHFHKLSGKWRAQIKVNGKTISLGLHKTQEEARDRREAYIVKESLEGFRR